MADVTQKGLLPNYNSIIIDEAHNLIRSAYDQFSIRWNEKQVAYNLQLLDPTSPRSARWNNILYHIANINTEIGKHHEDLKIAVNDSKNNLKLLMETVNNSNKTRFNPEKAYQEKPIIGSLNKTYSSVKAELKQMKDSFQKVFSVLEKIKYSVLKIDPKRSDYPLLHNFLEQGIETIYRFNKCFNSTN